MATPICAPFNTEAYFVNVGQGETDAKFLDDVLERQAVLAREGLDNSDEANFLAIESIFLQTSSMSPVEAKAYIQKLRAKNKNDALRGMKDAQIMAGVQSAFAGRANGVKQLAESFSMQRNAGQESLAPGLALLEQMKALSWMGKEIATSRLDVGNALRQYKLRKGIGADNFTQAYGVDQGVDLGSYTAEGLQTLADNKSMFEEIQALFKAGKINEALEIVDKLSAQIKFIDDPRDLTGVMSRWNSSWNTWDEVWINGLLSSTATAVVNATSAAWVVMRPLMQLGTAELFAKTGLGGAKVTAAANQAAAEAGAQVAAMYSSFQDAALLGWRAAKSEKSLLSETTQRITAQNLRENVLPKGLANQMSTNPTDEINRSLDMVGQLVRLPSRALLGMDEFTKVLALRGEVASNGVRRAVQQGADPTDKLAMGKSIQAEMRMAFDVDAGNLEARYRFNAGTENPKMDPGGRAAKYQANAELTLDRDVTQRSREAAFQENNRYARSISQGINNSPLRPVLKPFIPFTTTPTNILKQGLWESTGLDAAGKTFNIAKSKGFNPRETFLEIQTQLLNDPADSFRVGGQIAFMTLVGGTIYGMAMEGRITGGGPGQWDKGVKGRNAQNAWIAAKNIPYSIDVGGDVRIPIGRLGEPFATPMRMIADLAAYSGFMSRTEQDASNAAIVGMMAGGLFEGSFLKGLDSLMSIIRGAAQGGNAFEYETGRAVQNFVATQMPFSSLLAQADRMNNPYKAAYEGTTFSEMAKFWEVEQGKGVFGKLLNRLPGYEGTPELIDQVTGLPVPITPGVGPEGINPLLQAIPFWPRQSAADPVWDAVFAITGSYSEISLGERLKPTRQEQQEFNGRMAGIKIDGLTLSEAVMKFRQEPDVVEYVEKSGVTLKNSGIKKAFRKLLNSYAKRARDQMLRDNPNLQQRALLNDAIGSAQDANNVEEVKRLEEAFEGLLSRAKKGY
jgi:hypothetical protein